MGAQGGFQLAPRVVSIRVEMKGDDAVITTIGQSPRGTKVRLKTVLVNGLRGPKETFDADLRKAIQQLVPGSTPS